MTSKEKTNLYDRQSIRETSIKYMLGELGYEQAIRMIKTISDRNSKTSELATDTIKEVDRVNGMVAI